MEIGHPLVHELEQYLEVLVVGPLQYDDQLTIEGGVAEELGEMSTACCQHQAVGFE